MRDAAGKLLGTGVTDADGWYMISYKYTGKATTFKVGIPSKNLWKTLPAEVERVLPGGLRLLI